MNSPYERYKGFTEGPWYVDEVNQELVAGLDKEGIYDYVCDCSFLNEDKPQEVEQANAELIAAAPLLLQDCMEMWDGLFEIAEIFEEHNFHGSAMEVRSLLNRIKDRHK